MGLLIGNYNIRTILASPVVLTNAGIECSPDEAGGEICFVLILLFGIITLSCYVRIVYCVFEIVDNG